MSQISVIVTIYNVEKYLEHCIQSVVDQTFTDIEIILIDDGSTDACPALCDAWAVRDSRIRVIHKPNSGIADTRNVGIRAVSCPYFVFVDGDEFHIRIEWLDVIPPDPNGKLRCFVRAF